LAVINVTLVLDLCLSRQHSNLTKLQVYELLFSYLPSNQTNKQTAVAGGLAYIEINNKARHNLINAKCRWRSDRLDGAGSFREPLGQMKVMQIRQRETTHELFFFRRIVLPFTFIHIC
jgi:hypothetical protein